MNQADGIGRPDIQTAVADRNGGPVSTCSFFKKLHTCTGSAEQTTEQAQGKS